jgi:SAM-dependent methyltransferase
MITLPTILQHARERGQLSHQLRDFLAPLPHSPLFFERYYILESLKQCLPQLRPGRILDVGCGIKPYESLFKNIASEYIGIDHPTTISGSYGDATRADIYSEADELPFETGVFDTVLCTQVLEHLPRPWIKIDEMARVLKLDGTLLISVPFAWQLHEKPNDYFRYTEYGLASLLEHSGLTVITSLKRGTALTALNQIFIELFVSPHFKRPAWRKPLGVLCALAALPGLLLEYLVKNDEFVLGITVMARKKPVSSGAAGSNL